MSAEFAIIGLSPLSYDSRICFSPHLFRKYEHKDIFCWITFWSWSKFNFISSLWSKILLDSQNLLQYWLLSLCANFQRENPLQKLHWRRYRFLSHVWLLQFLLSNGFCLSISFSSWFLVSTCQYYWKLTYISFFL